MRRVHLRVIRTDVLSLCGLENVLLAVDELESLVGQPHADVARVKPAVLVQSGGGVLGILVVAAD